MRAASTSSVVPWKLALLCVVCAPSVGFGGTELRKVPDPVGVQTSAPQAADYSVRGVVTRLDSSSLAITRRRGNAGNLMFVLNPSTLRSGVITVGSVVSVRYRKDGNALVATAIAAHTIAPTVAAP